MEIEYKKYRNSFRSRYAKSAFMGVLFIFFFGTIESVTSIEQVAGLNVRHHQGQTFITWEEIDPPEIPVDVDARFFRDNIVKNMDKNYGMMRYRIYRFDKPITSVRGLTSIGIVKPLTCWNWQFYGSNPKRNQMAFRYVIEDGKAPVSSGTGIYVHNPKYPKKESGKAVENGSRLMKAYYAVTYSKDGVENKTISSTNATKYAVEEKEAQGVPILQRIENLEKYNYVKCRALHYYVRWEAPPNASIENIPIDYVVGIPARIEQRPTPVGLHMHSWGGSLLGGYGWWYNHKIKDATYLIASNQIPYDWWTGYHEFYYEPVKEGVRQLKEKWQKGLVRPYTMTRLLSFLDWAANKYDLDLQRVFTAGSSMGGTGAPMLAIRNPDRIAWCVSWVGVHDPGNSPQFTGSFENVYGKKSWEIKFEDGTPAFFYYKNAWYLHKYPKKEIGFITWSNGKNDGPIGWHQAIEFLRAMQETKRPHLFTWRMQGHLTRARMPKGSNQNIMPIDIRIDQSLPAFTNCSLDDDPGTAKKKTPEELEKHKQEVERWNKENKRKKTVDLYDGDSEGQINAYLFWETHNIVDKSTRWELIVGLIKDAHKSQCHVSLTPRRLQNLKVIPGENYRWTNVNGGREIQSGEVIADKNGLLTLEKVKVGKTKNRIKIWKP